MPLLRGLSEAAHRLGLQAQRSAQAVGLEPGDLADADRRLPRARLVELVAAFDPEGQHPDLGLELARATQAGDFAVLDYAIRNSPSLGDALGRLAAYHRLLHDGIEIELVVHDDDSASVRYAEPTHSPRQLAEWAVATWMVVGRQLTGQRLRPLAVEFQHAAPAELSAHRELFEVEPSFGAEHNAVRLPLRHLELPVQGADPRLAEVIGSYAEQLLTSLPDSTSLEGQVRREIARQLRGGDPSLESVAGELGASARTLQRRLKTEGTSFKAIIDDLRRTLSHRYLSDHSVAIDEIAFLLGFSEASAFHRAFKKWEGMTPAEFRSRAA